jgi:hypothetical protein
MARKWLRASKFALIPLAVAAIPTLFAGVSLGSDSDDRARPHPAGFTEGYGNEKVVVFKYPQHFYCNDEIGDDLDGPGHRGDGVPAERDPDEFQHPNMGPPGSPCIVGDTGSGSLPRMDPTGRPVENSEPVWAILPFFDSEDPDPVIDAVDPTTDDNVDHQCPEPGLPYTEHRGAFGTCTMHPSTLHAEPIVALGAGDIALPNHSHIIDGDQFTNPIWWQTIAVRVTDRNIWPDFDGRCPANIRGGPPCLTSLAALRAAQARGQASPDTPSNVWLFFDSRQLEPDPTPGR